MGGRRFLMGALLEREFFDRLAEDVAPDLLGCVLTRATPEGVVSVRLTEVEAYAGPRDPASHAYGGPTKRNAVMFGPPGHAYVYFTYGMHFCVNLVCLGEDTAAAVLLRAGEIIEGRALAFERRPAARGRVRDLARGPARLCEALGIDRDLSGVDVCSSESPLRVSSGSPAPAFRTGPRTGVSSAKDVPWRFWIDGDPSVSPYRVHMPRRRTVIDRG
jgi:DNA-3-methyladenine glycosylase